MPTLIRFLLLCALMLGATAPAGRAGEPLTVAQTAEQTARAVAAGDASALRALASRDDPDPWRVVDALLAKNEVQAALAYAKVVPRRTVAKLAAYIASRHGVSDAADRKAVDAMTKAFHASAWEQMLQATDPVKDKLRAAALVSIPLIRLAYGRGLAQRNLGDGQQSASTLSRAAEAAVKVGWVRYGARAYREASSSARGARDLQSALRASQARVEVLRYLGDDRAEAFALLDRVGTAQAALGTYETAAQTFAQAARLFGAQGDLLNRARALNRSGLAQQGRGRPGEAVALFDEALSVSRKAQAVMAISLAQSAIALLKLGSYEKALARCAEALPLLESLQKRKGASQAEINGYRLGVLSVLTTMGNTRRRLGQYARALKRLEEALAYARTMTYAAGIASIQNNIGNVQLRMGDYDEAIQSYKDSLAICMRVKDRRRTATALTNLGNAERDHGRGADARGRYEAAIEIFTALEDDERRAYALNDLGTLEWRYEQDLEAARGHYLSALKLFADLGHKRGQALVMNNLGTTYEREDDFEKAAHIYRQALEKLEAFPDPSIHVAILWSQAYLAFRQDQPQASIELVRQAIGMVSDMASGLAEGEGASTRDVFRDLFDVGVRAAIAADDVDALTWMFEHGRADELRKGLVSRSALAAVVVPESLRVALASAHSRLEVADRALRRAQRSKSLERIRAARKALDAALEEVKVASRRLQREAKAAAPLVFPSADDLAAIRSHLAPGEAYLAYGLTDGEAAALVVRPTGGRLVRLGSSQVIRKAAVALDVSSTDVAQEHVDAAAAALRKLLVDPLGLARDAGLTRILVSPHEVLGYVPFALLFPQYEIAYVPSGTTYGILRAQAKARGTGVLALGDPDYTTHAKRLARLTATRAEVEKIGTRILLGKDASETALPAALAMQKRWRAVHFACHGLVDPERAWRSSLALAADDRNDGLLMRLEILTLKIAADLVVLSACETGKGRVFRTEGIVGLTRAFMSAGAPRVICSLWKVDDRATQALMLKFYELWNPKGKGKVGLGTADALRQAQAYVRSQKQWEHPYFWAAWVLVGLAD